MRRAGTATAVALLAAVVGCTGSSGGASGPSGSATSPPPVARGGPGPLEHCPDVTGAAGSYAAVDYVDFVQALGRQYVAAPYVSGAVGPFTAQATRADLGRIVLRSKCSFSALNDRTHKNPGEPHDGDTGFLPAGTPIYAVHGWSAHCRLAAERDGRLRVYFAYRKSAAHARPRDCAVAHLT